MTSIFGIHLIQQSLSNKKKFRETQFNSDRDTPITIRYPLKTKITKSMSKYCVCPPCTARQSRQHCLMDWTSCTRKAWGMLFHSWCSHRSSCGRLSGRGWFSRKRRPSWAHNCSMGLRSGLFAGHAMRSTPACCMKALTLHISYLRPPFWPNKRVEKNQRKIGCQMWMLWEKRSSREEEQSLDVYRSRLFLLSRTG